MNGFDEKMPNLSEVQTLIKLGLEEVRSSPKHILRAEIRRSIYRIICPAAESPLFIDQLRDAKTNSWPVGYFKYTWLVLLTARKVLPVLKDYARRNIQEKEKHSGLINFPGRILMVAEKVARRKIEINEANSLLCSDFYLGMSGAGLAFPYPVSCSAFASYEALVMMLYGANRYDLSQKVVEAFSAIDENAPGIWSKNYFPIDAIQPNFYSAYFLDEQTVQDRKTGYPSIFHPPIPIRYDLEKRLTFWEWWLSSAVPEALERSDD